MAAHKLLSIHNQAVYNHVNCNCWSCIFRVSVTYLLTCYSVTYNVLYYTCIRVFSLSSILLSLIFIEVCKTGLYCRPSYIAQQPPMEMQLASYPIGPEGGGGGAPPPQGATGYAQNYKSPFHMGRAGESHSYSSGYSSQQVGRRLG